MPLPRLASPLACALVTALCAPLPAMADPSFGFGFTLLTNGDVAAGVRIFSDDRRYKPAASLGIDYKFKSKSFRPAVGVAYLDRDIYADLTIGLDLNTNQIDYGIGLGKLWNSTSPAAAPAGGGAGPTVGGVTDGGGTTPTIGVTDGGGTTPTIGDTDLAS